MEADDIREMFAGFGPVSVRRMFSGAGIFADGVMIALVARGVIYLKADERTVPKFEQEGLGTFTYSTKQGERALNSYWRMPDRLYDDSDELAAWARDALAAARRSAAPKQRRKAPAKPKPASAMRRKRRA